MPRDINATGNTVESFNQSAPMTLGIRPRVTIQLRNFAPGPKWALPRRELKKWLIEYCLVFAESRAPPAFVRAGARTFNGHHISNVRRARERRLMQLTFVHKIA